MSKKIWTKEKCLEEALKYSSRKELLNNCLMAYHAAQRQGFLDEICSHMPRLKRKLNTWTFENCRNEALKYNHKRDFIKGSPSTYQIARVKGWLKEICTHMKPLNNLYQRDVYCIRSTISEDIYIGLSVNAEYRYTDHLRKPTKKVAALLKTPHILEILDKKLLPDEAAEKEKYYIQMYKDLGYTVLNTTKGGELGKHDSKWNYETIKNAVNTIKTRTEFHKTYPGAANVASKKGWLEELLKPLPNKNEPEINFFGYLYTISEISKQLNISRKKLYQRYKSGKRNFDLIKP